MPNLIYAKYSLTNNLLDKNIRSVLDVGCRDGILKKYLRTDISYTGMDLLPGPGVDHVGSVENGLPFDNSSFDAVVALDLLEHTERIWYVFDEILRVSSKQAIVLVPNAYHWLLRLQYMRGKEMNKYLLPVEPILDRHRWLVSYNTAQKFCHYRAEKAGWNTTEHILFGGRRTALFDWAIYPFSKNMAAWAVVYEFGKNQTD